MAPDGPTSPASGPFAAPVAPSLVGEVLDNRYRIIRKLGEGGMGEVYAAEHMHIEKKYAIKLLRQEIVSNPEAVSRFRQEARSSSSIGHRNIIAIDDFGVLSDGRIYMAMELLNGAALNDLITTPQPVDRLLNILIQTGHGLAAAHAKNIVHRDMKPENVFVTIGPNGEDVPKLLDFGIAKVAGNDGNNNLTKTGTIFGTPFYMAPEQALGNVVDARTDIYAVGVIMYEVFAGSLPFQGESFMGILTQHITTEPEPVAQRAAKAGRQLPPGLAEIITKCMQKNPAQRFGSMDELVNELVNIYRGIAGPGMSTYMEAFTGHPGAPTQGRMAAPTPPPMMPSSTPGVAPTMHVTPGAMPQMNMPTGSPSGPQVMPQQMGPGPSHAVTGGVQGYTTGAPHLQPKKSKTGLIIGIIAVLAIGGGVAAFVIVNGSGDGGGSGSQVANNGTDAGTSGTDPKIDAAAVEPKIDAAIVEPKIDAAAVEPKIDAADPKDPKDGGGSDTINTPPIDASVPAVVMIKVKIFLKNGVPFEAYDETGTKLFDGPDFLELPTGTTKKIMLKAKGFKTQVVSVDTSKTTQHYRLEPDRKVVVNPGSGSAIVVKPDIPDCTAQIVIAKTSDPRHKACKAQFCRFHKDDARCDVD